MNTKKNLLSLFAVGVISACLTLGFAQRASTAEYSQAEYGPLLAVLSKSKLTLADGITQAAAKAPETAISAKFETPMPNTMSSRNWLAAQKGRGGALRSKSSRTRNT